MRVAVTALFRIAPFWGSATCGNTLVNIWALVAASGVFSAKVNAWPGDIRPVSSRRESTLGEKVVAKLFTEVAISAY